MGLKMSIHRKKVDTMRFVAMGVAACLLTPFASWESSARVQEDNSACGFRFHGLSAHKDLTECGIFSWAVLPSCPEREQDLTEATHPLRQDSFLPRVQDLALLISRCLLVRPLCWMVLGPRDESNPDTT